MDVLSFHCIVSGPKLARSEAFPTDLFLGIHWGGDAWFSESLLGPDNGLTSFTPHVASSSPRLDQRSNATRTQFVHLSCITFIDREHGMSSAGLLWHDAKRIGRSRKPPRNLSDLLNAPGGPAARSAAAGDPSILVLGSNRVTIELRLHKV
ncbi:hypothetical protein VTK26DRAFT_4532 [Humicola hyalothermophila]